MTVKRRAFIGATSLGAVASAVISASGQANHGGEYGYGQRVRPNVTVGIGRGQAASMSVVWIPGPGRELPQQMKRQQVFGYVFIEGYQGELVNELFGGLEIYDLSSGWANIVGIQPGLG